ncbi:MAG TPA: ketoreductase, partial [Planctomycetes bacterium]|nr:ketoreductase [Planctomycetota bacterium]
GRRTEPLEAFAKAHPERAAYLSADVSKSGEAERIVSFVVERFGRLDVLVNN